MMAAYQPAPSGHPGLPHGHPGMAQNPGQHMGQAMMHPGVSGAPHVSQPGAMMGMQPGAGMGPGGMSGQHPGSGMAMQAQMSGQTMAGGMPNAQAMSHGMTPQQMHQQQQQQAQLAQMQQNPQLAMQHQQMRLRHQQMLAQQQAQMQGIPQGVQLTPAQMQHLQQQSQMQGGGQVQLPAHLMQQQMQLQRAQQQQMAQQQHAQQQQQQNHMAQQLAMQHANSQQSNQGQSGPQNPQNAQGQPTNPQQIRPPSRIENPNQQSQQPNQPQPHPQQAQGQPCQPQPQQTPQQAQQPNPQQQQQQQQQAMAMQQQRFAIMQRQQQAHAQQMRQMQAQGQGQQAQAAAQGGMWILRLMSFGDNLSSYNAGNGKDLSAWQSFVERHFAPEGRIVHSFDNNPNGSGSGKLFEVLRPTLPRYFWTYFDSGAHSLRLHTENAREVTQTNGMHLVTCQSAMFSVSYPNGARLELSGSLHVLFSVDNDTIECFRFQISGTEEILSRVQIEKVLSDYSPTMPSKTSPKMNKKALPKAQQKMQDQQDRLTIEHFPKITKGTMGIAARVQQFLEIGETMNVMSDLMQFSQEKKIGAEQAMEMLAAQYESQSNGGNPQINYPQAGQGSDSRTPNMQHMQMAGNGQSFSSPGPAHLNLPMQSNGMNGSPHLGNNPGDLAPNIAMANSHTPSPHQSNMAAPSMMPQHSQQGTNSSVASANTSPNVNNNNNNNNKRRRSTVKLEGDDGGGPDGNNNANRVRPSPRMSKKAKPQG